MPKQTTRIELTPDELQQEREAAARIAIKTVLEDEVEPLIGRLNAAVRQVGMMRGLIPEHILLGWLDVSRQTLRYEWGVPQAAQRGNTRFYDWEEVEEYFRDADQTHSSPK